MNPYLKTPPVVKNLIIVNLLVYLAVTLLPAVYEKAVYCRLFWFQDSYFHSWQFITYMFLHANFAHLFFNMFALWMFGRALEYGIGSKRFFTYYMVCGVGAALLQMGVAWIMNETQFMLIGASGAVMGLLLAFGVMYPNAQIYVFPLPFPIKAKWYVIGYGAIEVALGVSGPNTGVAHFAHVGGMLWGLLLLIYWKRTGKIRY